MTQFYFILYWLWFRFIKRDKDTANDLVKLYYFLSLFEVWIDAFFSVDKLIKNATGIGANG